MNVINQISGMAIDHIEGKSSYSLKYLAEIYRALYAGMIPSGVEVIESGTFGDFIKDSGVWRSNSATLIKVYDESGVFLGPPDSCEEVRVNVAISKLASKYISFEYRLNTNAHVNVNPVTGAQEGLMIMLDFGAMPIDSTGRWGFVGEGGPIPVEATLTYLSASPPVSEYIDWTSVTLDWSAMPALSDGMRWALSIGYQQVAVSVGYGRYDFDFSLDWVEFRNIRTSPPKLCMCPILLGSISSNIPKADMALTPSAISYFSGKWNDIPSASMQFFVNLLGSGVTRTALAEAAEMMFSTNNPAYSWAVPRYQLGLAQIIYTMTLTGSPDVEIPISSFQSIVRQGGATVAEVQAASDLYTEQLNTLNEQYTQGQMTEQEWNTARSEILADLTSRMVELNASRPSYLSCVIPNFVDYIDEILARQDGEVIIKKGYRMPDGSRNLEEIVRGIFEYVTYDQGARSASAQITAYKTKRYFSSVRRTVSGVSFVGMDSQGRRRIRCTMDLFLRPQDICVFGSGANDSMTVGTITYIVSDKSAVMQVTEQDESF
jgi:hypothetical protein